MAGFIFYVPFALRDHLLLDFQKYGFKRQAEMESFNRNCDALIKRAEQAITVAQVDAIQRNFNRYLLPYCARRSKYIQRRIDYVCRAITDAKSYVHSVASPGYESIILSDGTELKTAI